MTNLNFIFNTSSKNTPQHIFTKMNLILPNINNINFEKREIYITPSLNDNDYDIIKFTTLEPYASLILNQPSAWYNSNLNDIIKFSDGDTNLLLTEIRYMYKLYLELNELYMNKLNYKFPQMCNDFFLIYYTHQDLDKCKSKYHCKFIGLIPKQYYFDVMLPTLIEYNNKYIKNDI